MIEQLSIDDYMTIDGVIFSGWNPLLRTYGPLKGPCTISVRHIITLLNNDVTVLLNESQSRSLYFLVKQYNELLDFGKSNKPRAQRAEEVLYANLYGEAQKQEHLENEENPFIDPENLDIAAETISLTSHNNGTAAMQDPLKGMRTPQIKRVHAYDIFAHAPSETSSFSESVERVNEMMQFGDIDFDLS